MEMATEPMTPNNVSHSHATTRKALWDVVLL